VLNSASGIAVLSRITALRIPDTQVITPSPLTRNSDPGAEAPVSVFSIVAFGVRIQFRVPNALLDTLPAPIIPGAEFDDRGPADAVFSVQRKRTSQGIPVYELAQNGTVIGGECSLEPTARALESCAQLTVATLAKDSVFVHAGTVGWQGKAIVMPGRSFSGKSTLTMAMVRAGAQYYSDEYAIFDREGRVHPYWRIPRFREDSGRKVASRLLGDVLDRLPPVPIPLGWVLLSRYQTGIDWQPRRLTPGETLLGLLDNTVALRRQPEHSIKTLARAIAKAEGFQGLRGEAADLVRKALAQR